jgi:1,2-diacylglycerol 3-beta-glucosyltransferase
VRVRAGWTLAPPPRQAETAIFGIAGAGYDGGTVLGSLVGVIVFAAGLPVACACAYLLVLAAASAFHRPPVPSGQARTRLAAVVPAHDEAEMIATCVRTLLDQRYPSELYRVVVVADNCTDATAEVASAAGAEVMVRRVPDLCGKGHALRWATDRLLATPAPPDAVVVIDADSVADPDFLRELEAVFAAGHPVVQADDIVRTEPGQLRSLLEAAALLLRNRVRFAGRAKFGLPASLCGNGMLLGRSVLEAHPWQAFSATEDSEYSLTLLVAGLPTTFARRARVMAAATAGEHGAYTQSLRWDGGRLALTRGWMLPLLSSGLKRRDPALLSVALDLAMPPLGALVIAVCAGSAVSAALAVAGVVDSTTMIPWLLAFVVLPAYLLVGLASCRVPPATFAAFLLAPWFLVRKLRVYAKILRGFDTRGWVRTQRPAEIQGADSDAP